MEPLEGKLIVNRLFTVAVRPKDVPRCLEIHELAFREGVDSHAGR
jgi:hypothetical protein